MANIVVPRRMPAPVLKDRRARNGMMPSAQAMRAAAARVNWYAVNGLRRVHQDAFELSSAAGTSFVTRRGAFHSSESPGSLYLYCQCATRVNQEWTLTVDDGTTTTTSAQMRRISTSSAATSTSFDGLAHLRTRVALAADTAYTWRITQAHSGGPGVITPVSSVALWEWAPGAVDTAQTYVCDTRAFYNKGPIYDADMQRTVEAAHQQWKHGPQLISMSVPDNTAFAVYWTTSSASYVNMLESGASTTVSSSTPGFNLPLTYHAPYHTTDIRAILAVYARQDAGTASNDVKLEDSSGTLGTLSNFSNSAFEWKTTAVTLTGGASQKVDLQFRCDGTNSLRVAAVGLYIKES